MGKAARACQGDCGAARPLLNGVMAKDKNKLNDEREQRLAEALRANLKRRKEQARAAKQGGRADEMKPD
jgi:hypothetical protein